MKRTWIIPLVAGFAIALTGCVGYGYPGSGYGTGYPSSGGGYGYPGYGNPGYANTIRCESNDNRTRYCSADTRGGVRLSRQLSDARCIQGRTWGYDSNRIWVSRGCRAEFITGTGGGSGPGYGYPGYGNTIRCESIDNRTRYCSANTRGGVRLSRQLSDARCIQGRTWGYDNNRIWVSRGCRAEFITGTGGGNGPGYGYPGYGNGQIVRCESQDRRQRRCNVSVRRNVQLSKQLSNTRCIQGRNWGWDRGGIWVNGGCRGEFRVY